MYFHGSKTKGIKKLMHDISLHGDKWIGMVLGQWVLISYAYKTNSILIT